jgi:hypothetical protein
LIEFGMIGFSQVAIESAVASTAREASIGHAVGGDRVQYVRQHLRTKLDGLINADKLVVAANTVSAGGVVGEPDICMDDPPRVGGACNPPLAYEEINGIPGYQGTVPAVSLGSAGDLIELRVYYPWRVQFPFMKSMFGDKGVIMITANAIVKNEPF